MRYETMNYPTQLELIKIFFTDYREADTLFQIKLSGWEKKRQMLRDQIKRLYKEYINNIEHPFTRYFQVEILKFSPLMKEFETVLGQINRLKRLRVLAKRAFNLALKGESDFEERVGLARGKSIEEVVGAHAKRGRGGFYFCPLHGEKTASLKIYPETNSFYCFGCHVGGDSIKFVQLVNKCDFKTAVDLFN